MSMQVRKSILGRFKVWSEQANPMPAKIRAAIKNLENSRAKNLLRSFGQWKENDLRNTKDAHINTLKKQPRIIDGAEKLNKLTQNRPRKALRSANKKKQHHDKLDNSCKKLKLIAAMGLTGPWNKWVAKTNAERLRRAADKCMDLPAIGRLERKLTRKPLRQAFDKIKATDPIPKALGHAAKNL
jgi:hypothetical protein